MKKTLIILFVLLSANLFGQNGDKNFIDQNYIEVTGKAEKEIAPDEIYLQIIINEKDNKGKVSLEKQENEMIKSLKSLGIDIDKSLKVRDQGSNFKDYLLKKNVILTSKEYQLLVHTGQMVGKVFVALEEIGISNINVERVDHSEMEKFKREVKVAAVKDGKEKASDLAKAIRQDIGRALYIREIEGYYPKMAAPMMIRGMSSDFNKAEEVANLEFEKIHIESSVQIFFELK
jgi:uncharacterized protein YggE